MKPSPLQCAASLKIPQSRCRVLWTVAVVLITCGLTLGQEDSAPPSSEASAEPPKLQVRQLAGPLHTLGELRFDLAKRTVHFPATVNMNEGAIEFALVGTQGKIHEAVFATEIRPMHLRTVLSLLSFEPSAPPKEGEPADDPSRRRALVDIDVSWASQPDADPKAAAGRKAHKKRVPLRECIVVMEFEQISEFDEKVHLSPLPKGPWNYTGSRFDDYGFEAERELDFIGVQFRPSALFNLPHPKNHRDDLWQANAKVLPEVGTPVTIEITLPAKKK